MAPTPTRGKSQPCLTSIPSSLAHRDYRRMVGMGWR